MENGKGRGPTVGLCGLPLIEQKALDEWGTERKGGAEVSSPVGWRGRCTTKQKLQQRPIRRWSN
jgi:hypothetical protein